MELNGTMGSTWKQSEQREITKCAILLLVLAVKAILLIAFAVVFGGLERLGQNTHPMYLGIL
jgi:hypothetical protein